MSLGQPLGCARKGRKRLCSRTAGARWVGACPPSCPSLHVGVGVRHVHRSLALRGQVERLRDRTGTAGAGADERRRRSLLSRPHVPALVLQLEVSS